MRKMILLGVISALLAGCDDFPIEPVGGDDFTGVAHHQVRAAHAHGGMDDGLLRTTVER